MKITSTLRIILYNSKYRRQGHSNSPYRNFCTNTINKDASLHKSFNNKPKQLEELGDRMKSYERSNNLFVLDGQSPFILRLDGCRFSTFTKGLNKPFDKRIHLAMLKTTADLIKYFNCTTAYTESDEISLIYPNLSSIEDQSMVYGGRVAKLISISASMCASRFNYHLASIAHTVPEKDPKVTERLTSSLALFDARVVVPPDEAECLNNIFWRSYDCQRNSISLAAHALFPKKDWNHIGSDEKIEILRKNGINLEDLSDSYRFGVIMKRRKYIKEAFNIKLQQNVTAERTDVAYASLRILNHEVSPQTISLMTAKVISKDQFPTFYDKFVPIPNTIDDAIL